MLARTRTYTVIGLEAVPIDIEVDVSPGLPSLTIVGLPDQAVRESRERIRRAIINSQFQLPHQRITVNLAPATLKKEGGHFDIAIALGILAASHQLDPAVLASIRAIGELALDGGLRPTPGVLPIAMATRTEADSRLLVPAANAEEAAFVHGVSAVAVAHLREAAAYLDGTVALPLLDHRIPDPSGSNDAEEGDFADVKGHTLVKRALEIAAAGAHHVLLIGPPGSGKSMLAKRLPTILPNLSAEEALACAMIRSVLGTLRPADLQACRRPFRAPHHTSSAIALIGGGSTPRPGDISLAHHGVLFLDELPEFSRQTLESLRQPLEDGDVRVARVKRIVTFPCRFMLVAAMNPCPFGTLCRQTRSVPALN